MADAFRWVGSPPAARFYMPRQLGVEGLRWQALAGAYDGPQAAARGTAANGAGSGGGPFDWGDAGIGVVMQLGVAALGAALVVVGERVRREKVAL
jgi:hypothetical protein